MHGIIIDESQQSPAVLSNDNTVIKFCYFGVVMLYHTGVSQIYLALDNPFFSCV